MGVGAPRFTRDKLCGFTMVLAMGLYHGLMIHSRCLAMAKIGIHMVVTWLTQSLIMVSKGLAMAKMLFLTVLPC